MDADKPMNVLVVEGDAKDRAMLVKFLTKSFPGASVHEYDPIAKGRPDGRFDWSQFDVLIMDYRLGPDDTGLDWLRTFKSGSKNFPATILLTAVGNEDLAVRAIRYGAHDYFRKQKLNGKKLTESVRDAFNIKARDSKIENSLTINASRFSKSFFYGQFEMAFEEVKKGENRAVLMIRTDGYEALLKSLGVLAMDEIEKYMASNAVKIFNVAKYKSRATRFTDSSIAILVGGYKDDAHLEEVIQSFCTFVKDSPPVVNDSPIPITISIGAVPIVAGNANVHSLLEQAEKTADEAEEESENSFVVFASKVAADKLMDTSARARVFDAKSAIRENRLQAMFRPITGVSEESEGLGISELFEINSRFVTHSGEYLRAGTVLAQQPDDTLGRVIDRWKIRECVKRLVSGNFDESNTPGFLIELGSGSCADANLVRWIADLIKQSKMRSSRLKNVCLSVSTAVFMPRLKPVSTMLDHLKKQHGFRFALKDLDDPTMLKMCFKEFVFDLVVLSPDVVKQIIDGKKDDVDVEKLVSTTKELGALSIAGGVQSTNDLHAVISADVDFVHGDFIGPEQEEIEAAIGIEAVALD